MNKIILVGAGTMGQEHANVYADMQDVQVVAVVGKSEAALRLGAFRKANVYPSLQSALHNEQADIVDICTPTFTHSSFIREAAEARKHVLCEKPLARTVAEGRATIKFCIEAGVLLMIGHVLRFSPEYAQAKKMIHAGDIGTVGTARLVRKSPYPTTPTDWYADDEKSGGVILDLMLHDFDFLRDCFGPVERVYAKRARRSHPHRFDYALVTLRHTSGVIAHVEGAWGHPGPFIASFEIAGNKGILESDNVAASAVKTLPRNSGTIESGVSVPSTPLRISPFHRQIAEFIEAVRSGTPFVIQPEESLAALAIAEAAARSVETGAVVAVDAKGAYQ